MGLTSSIQQFNVKIPLFEEVQSDKKKAIEDILKIKTNFKLCSRCGKQLHHGIKICERCGKDNKMNTGSTVGNILYTGKHRLLATAPLSITPEMIYTTYKERLGEAGVTEEEFLDYVEAEI